MDKQLAIIPCNLLDEYVSGFDGAVKTEFDTLRESELSTSDFSFYTSVSAVFSSKIEGENIDIDSFVKHKRFGVRYEPDYTQKIDDLYEAYSFSAGNSLTPLNIERVHNIITKNILHPSLRGSFRRGNMFVITGEGKIEYIAASPEIVAGAMQSFYADLSVLLEMHLTFAESFFFASMIHLVFVKIHPFEDGNGRTARLIEKWFLAEKLGTKAWFLQSEKMYYERHSQYYANIRQLGLEYETLNYLNAMPFLQMLPSSL